MRSPFPGMDPYLEAHWLNVHPRLVVGACDRNQDQLGESLVARIGERLIVELYPMRLEDRLPALGIPLRSSDADAVLELQPLIDGIYTASRCDRTTDYCRSPEPPLSEEEAAWADSLLTTGKK